MDLPGMQPAPGGFLMKTMYIRETDPESKKQRWIPVNGVKSDRRSLMINPNVWKESEDPFQVLYTKKR